MGQSQPDLFPRPERGGKCPVCGARSEADTRPFCSVRCADVDLIRWLGGRYAIPGGGQDADEDGDDTQAAQRTDPERDRDRE